MRPDHETVRVLRKTPHHADQLAASLGIQAIEQRDQFQALTYRGIGILGKWRLIIEELLDGYIQHSAKRKQVRDAHGPQIGLGPDYRLKRADRYTRQVCHLGIRVAGTLDNGLQLRIGAILARYLLFYCR